MWNVNKGKEPMADYNITNNGVVLINIEIRKEKCNNNSNNFCIINEKKKR